MDTMVMIASFSSLRAQILSIRPLIYIIERQGLPQKTNIECAKLMHFSDCKISESQERLRLAHTARLA